MTAHPPLIAPSPAAGPVPRIAKADPVAAVRHVHPPCWWAGMASRRLQLLLHGDGVGECEVRIEGEGARLEDVVRPANRRYLLLHLDLAQAPAQTLGIVLSRGGRERRLPYKLARRRASGPRGLDAADAVYLLVPDRFARAGAAPRAVRTLLEAPQGPGPDDRHGGNLAGIEARLDYLAELGVTALWPTPVLENNMPACSYHGYATTDYYSVDPRLGTAAGYRRLVRAAHRRGLKVVHDVVLNHCGDHNFLYADRPADDWFDLSGRGLNNPFDPSVLTDPYTTPSERQAARSGWFAPTMPRFDLRRADVFDYLVQASVWWTEYAGFDAVRVDTFPYVDAAAMSRWCQRMEREFPGLTIVGETWVGTNVGVACWQRGCGLVAPVGSALPVAMDFPLMDVLRAAVDEDSRQLGRGLHRVHHYLAQDAVFADPLRLLTFLGNHDTGRFAATAIQATRAVRYTQALTLLLTLRGMPQLLYGDEVGLHATKAQGDGVVRSDFPGGLPGSRSDAFSHEGRAPWQRRLHDVTRRLLAWRRANPDLMRGALRHYAVSAGVYVYARTAGRRSVLVVMNGTDAPATLCTERYRDVLTARFSCDVLTGREVHLEADVALAPREVLVLPFGPTLRAVKKHHQDT